MAVSGAVNSSCFVLLLFLQFGLQLADARSLVKSLPGYRGPLPFKLETGYIGVGEADEVQLFYYFVESQGNPKEDPLMLWLTGGPGCSAFSGLVFEIGPLKFKVAEYNGSLPTLVLNTHSWTQVSNIIFVDMPVGTGFSYAKTFAASQTSDLQQVSQADQFLRKWLIDHPQFLSNPAYIGGDSYSGIFIPAIAQQISNGSEEGIIPFINLKGILAGNPLTDSSFDRNSKIPFAHGMGLISDELYEVLKSDCRGEYRNVDPSNTECIKHVQTYDELVSGINPGHILEAHCTFASPRPIEPLAKRTSQSRELLELEEEDLPKIGCRTYSYLLCKYWMNNNIVFKALRVRKGPVKTWKRCNYGLPYTKNVKSSIKYHEYLAKKGYRSLIYSGDHDLVIPFIGTQAWIRSLNYSLVDDWRPWYVEGQVGGYTRTYANGLTFATLKGGGHTAPEYKPAEAFAMYKRWMTEKPL
ncbi:hypothetical protein K2173_008063 [Erythroxylum novogranatense]|uniref:Uncharacterized protein n=1 Tax=Erythroxylum novogranatense TaxID=1862640 RepID=A0AAV8T8J0_9ROSI|nr:hypothetical protein K2173_008063 [Erythroxylum novogranatense]